MQKNRFVFGVRTPRVVQATDGPKLSVHTTTRVEVCFTVTGKKQKTAHVEKGRGSAARHAQGAFGCRLCAVMTKVLRNVCEVLES